MFVILLEISSSIPVSHIINSMCLCLAIKKLFILVFITVLFCFVLTYSMTQQLLSRRK